MEGLPRCKVSARRTIVVNRVRVILSASADAIASAVGYRKKRILEVGGMIDTHPSAVVRAASTIRG